MPCVSYHAYRHPHASTYQAKLVIPGDPSPLLICLKIHEKTVFESNVIVIDVKCIHTLPMRLKLMSRKGNTPTETMFPRSVLFSFQYSLYCFFPFPRNYGAVLPYKIQVYIINMESNNIISFAQNSAVWSIDTTAE